MVAQQVSEDAAGIWAEVLQGLHLLRITVLVLFLST